MGFYINPCADELLVSSFHSFEAGIANAKELQKFLNFCAAHLPVKRDTETKFPISYFGQTCPK